MPGAWLRYELGSSSFCLKHDRLGVPIMFVFVAARRAPVVLAKLFGDHSRQCEQMPAISITGLFGTKPAARHECLRASATAAPVASPTVPQRSQMRNTTGSLPA